MTLTEYIAEVRGRADTHIAAGHHRTALELRQVAALAASVESPWREVTADSPAIGVDVLIRDIYGVRIMSRAADGWYDDGDFWPDEPDRWTEIPDDDEVPGV